MGLVVSETPRLVGQPQTPHLTPPFPSPAHLAGLQTQFDLHLARLGPNPHVDLGG